MPRCDVHIAQDITGASDTPAGLQVDWATDCDSLLHRYSERARLRRSNRCSATGSYPMNKQQQWRFLLQA